jgi:putative endonuclease
VVNLCLLRGAEIVQHSSFNTQRAGNNAEDEALEFLYAKGLTLVARNFRCKGGEIDLIMQTEAELVFVEVRLRTHAGFGGAAASVSGTKQRRLRIAAQVFLLKTYGPARWPACRFDVLAHERSGINWIQGAF